jgi:hypothetical protein
LALASILGATPSAAGQKFKSGLPLSGEDISGALGSLTFDALAHSPTHAHEEELIPQVDSHSRARD